MRLEEATWTDAATSDTDLALVPVGSTEQHGPHAPLGTDTLNAEAVAMAGAEAYGNDVIIAPTIPIGIAEEHRHFTGTLWVSGDTFRRYIREIVSSLAHHGWTRVIIVNGHGGNVDALRETCARITRHDDAYAVAFTWFHAIGSHREDMGHGGPIETAMLQHTHPGLVREDRVEAARSGASEAWGDWVSGVNLAYDSAEFSENGVVGDPTTGDARLGKALLEQAGTALGRLIETVAERDVDRPRRRSP